jgi:cell fate (sporulation/competence/biofilm development) regulator YlbF (YheA/YmcA/DUF963 family)
MDIIEKARELGKSIAQSEELDSLKKCEQEVQNDSKAKLFINDQRQLQAELIKAIRKNNDAEIIESIKKMLADKQKEINEYDVTRRFIEAKQRFDKLVKKINDVITFSITGEEGCSSEGCSSCRGCK